MADRPGRPPPPPAVGLDLGRLGVAGAGIGRQAARRLQPSHERRRPGSGWRDAGAGQGGRCLRSPSVASANRKEASVSSTSRHTPAWNEKQVCRQLADFAIALRESRRINVEARWKRQTAAERSSYVRPIARRAVLARGGSRPQHVLAPSKQRVAGSSPAGGILRRPLPKLRASGPMSARRTARSVPAGCLLKRPAPPLPERRPRPC